MEVNPYKSPAADVSTEETFKRSVWWKIYFFLITILSAFGMLTFFLDPNAGVSEYISLALWLIATVGLFSFTFLKPIFKPNIWLNVLIAYLGYNIAYYFITDIDLRYGMSNTEYYITIAVGWLMAAPAYYALFALSKSSNPVWQRKQ